MPGINKKQLLKKARDRRSAAAVVAATEHDRSTGDAIAETAREAAATRGNNAEMRARVKAGEVDTTEFMLHMLDQADAHATALEGAAAKLGNASRIAMSSTLHVGVITGALKSSVIPGGGKQQKKAIAGGGGKPKGGGGKPKGGGDSPPTTTRKRGKGGGDQKPIKGTN